MTRQRKSSGEGSVYPRKDGRWVATVPYQDALGVTKHATQYFHTEPEANRAYQKLLVDREKGRLGATDIKTVKQFTEAWLRVSVKKSVKPITYEAYEQVMRLHVVPSIGHIELKKLQHHQIKVMFNDRMASGLGPGGARKVYRILCVALNEAVRWNLIEHNPASGLRLPRPELHQATVLDPEQSRTFLRAIQGHRLEAFFAVALSLGLRKGEALALRWGDIDLDKGILHVRKTLQIVGNRFNLSDPKTPSSASPLPLPAPLMAKLRAHRMRQQGERRIAGDSWKEWEGEDLVFTNIHGGPIRPEILREQFNTLLDRAKLPRMTIHELRKSCATLLHSQGVSDKEIQMVMRHSSVNITRNLYIQGVSGLQRAALDDLSNLLFGDS